jgi:hypothetical protein
MIVTTAAGPLRFRFTVPVTVALRRLHGRSVAGRRLQIPGRFGKLLTKHIRHRECGDDPGNSLLLRLTETRSRGLNMRVYFPATFLSASLILSCHPDHSLLEVFKNVPVDAQRDEFFGVRERWFLETGF